MNPPLDLRLLPAAAGSWAVCVLALRTPFAPAAAATAAAAALVLGRWPRRAGRHRVPWLGWVSLSLMIGAGATAAVGTLAAFHVAHREAAATHLLEVTGPATRLHLRLTSEVRAGGGGHGAHALLTYAHDPGRGVRARVPVYAVGADPEWRVGQRVTVRGRLWAGSDHRLVLRISAAEEVDEPRGPHVLVDRLRGGVREASDSLAPHARGLVPGVAIGDDRRLPPHLAQAMRATSLTHITAVSGAHVSIVVGTVLTVAARAPRWVRATLAGAVLGGMVLVALPTPSVVRAGGMGALAILAFATRRPRLALPALLATVTLLLAHDPWLATSVGFSLSAAATLGIITSARPLATALGGGWWARVAAVPLAAQAWCAPLLLTFEASVATYAVPANALAMAALTPATLLGLGAALASLTSPALATHLASWGGVFTAWIAAVANFFARLPGARLPWVEGPGGVVALILLTAAAGCGLWLLGRARPWQA